MSDDVKTVAQEILDRAEGQIGTHSTDCHKYHLACFAAFVADALEAVQQTPAVDTGKAAKAIWEVLWPGTSDVMDDAELGQERAQVARILFALTGSGILQDAAEVEARGLERLIERVTDDGLVQVFGGEKFVSVALLVSEARAQQVREGN